MKQLPLITFTSKGLFCPKGNFFIDPWRPVQKAVITHAHGDHAYRGHHYYLTNKEGLSILKERMGDQRTHYDSIEYGEQISINGVKLSLHPAGHIIGSSQVRLEAEGEVWVFSGDYKLENDGISQPFEPVKCDVFISESTFALPCFYWKPQEVIFEEINQWWKNNRDQGLISILFGYALGKAQRLLKGLNPSIGPIFGHGSIINMTEIIQKENPGLFPHISKIAQETNIQGLNGSIILAPPSAANSPWMNRFQPYRTGYASGWMTIRGIRRRHTIDKGFVLSDHADWIQLQKAIEATEAKKIILTHGFSDPFAQWLREKGYDASTVNTLFNEDEE